MTVGWTVVAITEELSRAGAVYLLSTFKTDLPRHHFKAKLTLKRNCLE